MKTTIEISDDLGKAAKDHAAREQITLRTLIERGIRMVIRADRRPGQFKLRDASVDGNGLQAPFHDADWAKIREAIYTK